MSTHRHAREVDPTPPRTTKRRRTSTPAEIEEPADRDRVWVGSADGWVALSRVLCEPLVAQLVGEDVSWRIAVADWHARRPALVHLQARIAWAREGSALEGKRARLANSAAALRLTH
jgi:hypothetical protein